MDGDLSQILGMLILDAEGQRLAVKYSMLAKKDFFPKLEDQFAFEKKIIAKLPQPAGSRADADVAIVDELFVLYKSVNDVFICCASIGSENELVVLQLVEGVFNAVSQCTHTSFINTGITKQQVLDNLSEVMLVLDEVTDDGIIMETDEDKIMRRVKMAEETAADEAPAGESRPPAEQMFQKATQSAKQKILSSLLGSRGSS